MKKDYSRERNSWSAARQRCYNSNAPNYKDYGERGITMCEEWGCFENFLRDMGDRPPGTTLERTDNNGGYTPENCTWATPKMQGRNRRDNFLVTVDGKQVALCALADSASMNTCTLKGM